MRLQIGLERQRLTFVFKCTVEDQFPRSIWGGRDVATFVVLLETSVYVFREANIDLIEMARAADDVDELFLALFRGAASFRFTQLRRPTLRLLLLLRGGSDGTRTRNNQIDSLGL